MEPIGISKANNLAVFKAETEARSEEKKRIFALFVSMVFFTLEIHQKKKIPQYSVLPFEAAQNVWINLKVKGELGQLTSLQLHERKLTGVPAEISHLVNLKALYLTDNLLTEIPEEILELPKLEYLSLDRNQLTCIPKGISKLTALENMGLFHNQISDISENIGKLKQLKHLYLSGNKLSYLPVSLGTLPNLNHIPLINNLFYEFPEILLTLPLLTQIHLNDNHIGSLPSEEKLFPTAIKNIGISKNCIDITKLHIIQPPNDPNRCTLNGIGIGVWCIKDQNPSSKQKLA